MPDTRFLTSHEVARVLGISSESARRVLIGRLLWRERRRRPFDEPLSSGLPGERRHAREP